MYGHHLLLYSRVIWINRVRLPNLLVVSSTGKFSVFADASIRRKYTYMYWCSMYVCMYVCSSHIAEYGSTG